MIAGCSAGGVGRGYGRGSAVVRRAECRSAWPAGLWRAAASACQLQLYRADYPETLALVLFARFRAPACMVSVVILQSTQVSQNDANDESSDTKLDIF